MNLSPECKACLYNQIKRFLDKQDIFDNASKNEFLSLVEREIDKIPLTITPPKSAIKIYDILKENLGVTDPYSDIKKDSIAIAKQISKNLVAQNLSQAITIAVAGNAIDYGSQASFDIESNLYNSLNEGFCINHIDSFANAINNATNLLYIADNAGENYFDEILIKFLVENYHLKITYLVRGEAIINDLTMSDISEHKTLSKICDIKDSGVRSPGFIYNLANDESRALFDNTDLILAKGMGNFETLESLQDRRIFLLFKIKCSVVSSFLKQPLNALVFRNNFK
ncbi:MAG: ARMT1-like domain-containing protein [Helicobacteraceae bacterium]|nr:ARMT1-like domain-containing protein [Helicobacteraceae bacterium]